MAGEEEKKEEKAGAPACRGCIRWEKFGRSCHYFWELKKECSMYAANVEEMQ